MEITAGSLWLLLAAVNLSILIVCLYLGVFWRRRGQEKVKKKELVIVNWRPPPPTPFIIPEIFLYLKVKREDDEERKTPIGGQHSFPFQRMLKRDKRRTATKVSTRATDTPSPESTRNSICKNQKEALAKLVEQVKNLKVEKEAMKTKLEKSLKQCAEVTDQNEKQEKLIQDLQDKIEELKKEVNFLSAKGDSGKKYVPTAIVTSEEKREELREKILEKQKELTARVCKGLNMGRIDTMEVHENTDLFREVKARNLMLQQKVDFLSNKSLVQDMYIADLLQVIWDQIEHRVTSATPHAAPLTDSTSPSTRSPRRRPLPTAGNQLKNPPPREPVSQSGNTSAADPMVAGMNIRAHKKSCLLKTLEAKTLKMGPRKREKQSPPIE